MCCAGSVHQLGAPINGDTLEAAFTILGAHYIARHGESRVSKAAIISAVPPLMVQTPANPKGLPKKLFDDFQVALAANRSQFYRDVAAGPFYNYNKTGKPSEATIENWWRQGMMGGANQERCLSRGANISHQIGAGRAPPVPC
jgi:hypothetical protein